jgi:hypothetical protein
MANNRIQIKRSTSNATVTGLQPGELAFTQASNTFWVGAPDGTSGVIRIGGQQIPGTLTANQALVANATSGIDKVIVANLVPTNIWANGAAGTGGQVLTSNSSGGVFWVAPSAGVAGSDTQIQFNDGGTLAGDAGLTFNKTTDTLSTNTVLATSTVNAAVLSVGTSVVANTTRLAIGTAVGFQANGTIGTDGQILYSNGTTAYWAAVPAGDITAVTAGSGLTGGGSSGDVTLDVGAGNGITVSADAVAVLANSGLVANATGVHIVTSGDSTLIANSSGLYVNDATLSIATSQLSGDVALGTQTSGNYVASVSSANGIAGAVAAAEGATPSLYVVANNGIVANSSGVFARAANGITVDVGGINVNGGNGLVSNATGVHIGQGNGISVSADAIAVSGGSTLTVNATGVHVNNDLSITSLTTSGDVTVNGNTKLGDATSDVVSVTARVNTGIIPSANVTYDLGTNLLRWNNVYSDHIESVSGEFTGNLTVGGDLVVTGNVTTVNVSSLSVSDPLIKLAVNNTVSDTLYLGFTAHYNGLGNTTNHAGLVRDPNDKDFYLFSTYGDEVAVGNNTINVADPSFTLANLNVYVQSGGLVTNATHVAIVANSTVNVSIIANTLTLSSPLAGTSGGTGRSTSTNNALLVGNSSNGYNELTLNTTAGYVLQTNGTALVYDYLDGGTF